MASPWYTVYIHELAVAVGARQLDSVVQLVRALHWNRRAVDSIPARGHIVAFFTNAPGTKLPIFQQKLPIIFSSNLTFCNM